jgi:hypothetical protein
VKERPVRRPIEKTIGDEGSAPSSSKGGETAQESRKTIGPATPAAGVEIKATPVEKTFGAAPAPAAPAEADAPKPQFIDDLERLAKLKEAGVLTPEEFEQAKKKLLG